MPSVHDGSLNRLTCALREVGNLTQTWHLQRQHLERVEQPETSTTPPHPPHGLLVTPLFHRSWILKIFEENETFRQSTAIERNYFYQKMDRSIYKRRPRAVISKSAWSQNKRRKKKKTGDNKNGATMERRDPRILPPPLRKFIISKSGRIRRCRIGPLTKDQKASGHSYGFPGPMSKLVHQSACARIHGRCNGRGMRESVRDYEIPLCTDTVVSASRRRGWKSILLRTYRSWGEGVWIWNGTDGKSKRVHTEG